MQSQRRFTGTVERPSGGVVVISISQIIVGVYGFICRVDKGLQQGVAGRGTRFACAPSQAVGS